MLKQSLTLRYVFSATIGLLILLAGKGSCKTLPTGFVGLEKETGVWWFKTPAGKQFLSIGANHIEPSYWQSPSNSAFVLKTYGAGLFSPDGVFQDGSPAAEKWGRRVATNFNNWGFNTFGFHNPLSKSLHAAGPAYYVVVLEVPVPWGWNMPRSTLVRAFKRNPVDVFSDAFTKAVKSNAAATVQAYANDPRVLGYAYTDGPPWTVDDDPGEAAYQALSVAGKTIHPWVFALMARPAEAKGKQAWVALLKERYASPEKAAATYACAASTWDELASKTVWTSLADTAKATEDSQAFLLKAMRQWYAVRKNAIREFDQNHLILGDKLNMNRDSKYPGPLIQSLNLMKDYVDVITLQYYGAFEQQRDTLALIYKTTQKPILNGDTTRNPLWVDSPPGATACYDQLGKIYADDIVKLFSLPYYIGWHHCGYMRGLRQPYIEALKRGDQKTVEFYVKSKHVYREGFVSEFEEPLGSFVNPLSRALANCEKIHRAAGAPRDQTK
ncbi:MAG: hypothetical protein EPN23_08225 [Verrucomicrobia bacterium]|nr:MAG: hypothetical protein EPN23_08225 [Verrucomicrobiota bacterium]